MEEQLLTPDQARSLHQLINEQYEDFKRSLGDRLPVETERLGEQMAISNLIHDGKMDIARDRLMHFVEQYPSDFHLQMWACGAFQHLGLVEEAYNSMILMLVLEPDARSLTCRWIAKRLLQTGAPRRASVILDVGWEQKKKSLRGKKLESAKQSYYAL